MKGVSITAVSDLHGFFPELEGGNLLIVAGDLTASDKLVQHYEFGDWLKNQDYKKKIVIAGNHDMRLQELGIVPSDDYFHCASYLCDSGTEFEYLDIGKDGVTIVRRRLKIWGSPWTLTFPGINPKCTAFTGDEELLAEKFSLIPDDVDILVTHGPPAGIRDFLSRNGNSAGSKALRDAIGRVKPYHVIFGHIHEAYGEDMTIWPKDDGTAFCNFYNCSHVNERYEPVNKPIRIIL